MAKVSLEYVRKPFKDNEFFISYSDFDYSFHFAYGSGNCSFEVNNKLVYEQSEYTEHKFKGESVRYKAAGIFKEFPLDIFLKDGKVLRISKQKNKKRLGVEYGIQLDNESIGTLTVIKPAFSFTETYELETDLSDEGSIELLLFTLAFAYVYMNISSGI